MKYLICVFMAFIMLSSISVYSATEIALEAELANRVVAPVVVAVPADAKAKGGVEPDEPSSGKFIWAPGAPLTGGGGAGYVEFIIDIPKKAKYAIWGRVVAWDGNSDSFWVTWRPADPAEDPQVTQNRAYCWSPSSGNTWHWSKVNSWQDAGTFDRNWELDKGETTLRIGSREDAAMLDCLFITDNINTSVGAVNPRIPTKEDINAQLQSKNKAVNTNGKLSTTWASIKSLYY